MQLSHLNESDIKCLNFLMAADISSRNVMVAETGNDSLYNMNSIIITVHYSIARMVGMVIQLVVGFSINKVKSINISNIFLYFKYSLYFKYISIFQIYFYISNIFLYFKQLCTVKLYPSTFTNNITTDNTSN